LALARPLAGAKPLIHAEDVFGPMNAFYFSVKLEEGMQVAGQIWTVCFECASSQLWQLVPKWRMVFEMIAQR